MGNVLLLAAVLLGLLNASAFFAGLTEPLPYGFGVLVIASLAGYFLLKRDRTPQRGTILFAASLVVTAVQLLGGGYGPAAFLYPLLFVWMRKGTISGPVLGAASSIAVIEFCSPMAEATGIFSGFFDPGGILRSITESIVAGVIPLASLFVVEFLGEDKPEIPTVAPDNTSDRGSEPAFPDDVARSLIPILKKSTNAGGVFLFTRDNRGVSTLNEFVSGSGSVSARYMTGPDDPVVQLLDTSRDDIVQTTASRLALGGSEGLPWYTSDPGFQWVTVLQFRRGGELRGFLVLDFDSREKRKEAASILVDSAFLLSVAWERSHQTGTEGFLAICDDMSNLADVRQAVHRLVTRVLRTWPETTASVAILGEGGVLRIFESLGPHSEGRAGREFGLRDGFAGLAVTRREPMRRLRMGVGQKAVNTYGENDTTGETAGSCCAVPLEDSATVLGVLTVESAREQYFAPEDLSLLTAFATVFSLAVSRKNLVDALSRMKKNDRLTGFPLLSSFHAKLNDLVRGVQSRAWSVAVLAVDISGFGEINSAYGYSAGDKVLENTARRLKRAVGSKAVFARSGADSFLICLQEVDRVSAEAFAARIHEEFADSPVRVSDRNIPVAVSIGGAVSHVDKMIRKLPAIAMSIAESLSEKPGFTTITEVDQFYEQDRRKQ